MDFAELASVGAEPSPTHLASFVVEHLELRGPARRNELIAAAEAEWHRVAHSPMKTALVPRMKKALQILADQGTVRPAGVYGIWKLAESDQITDGDVDELGPGNALDGAPAGEDATESDESGLAEREIGEGSQQVYCYYLDAYRELAAARGESDWPIKVGMTAGQLSARMESHRTALPEAPRLALIFWTDYASTLEKVIHGVLTLRGKRSAATGGTEWFVTTPGEIVEIYAAALGIDVEGSAETASLGWSAPTQVLVRHEPSD